jgi:hypothetical protein
MRKPKPWQEEDFHFSLPASDAALDPLLRLACAVIVQSLVDASNLDLEAWRWLLVEDAGRLHLEAFGITPGQVLSWLVKGEGVYETARQKRAGCASSEAVAHV